MSCNNHLQKISGICCQKIIPLVFDQSYSYYEQLCAFANKLNELVEAVNLQNMTISEFENELSELFSQFKSEMRLAFADFQIEMQQEYADFVAQIESEWNAYKSELSAEWASEKALNAAFRSDMQTAWTTYQNQLNTQWNNYKTLVDTVLHTFDTNINQTIADFSDDINDFKADETAARTAFEASVNSSLDDMENRIDNINVGGQVESVPQITALETTETTETITISNLPNFINSDFENNFVRVYHCADITANPRVISFVKRVNFSELSTDTDIPNATGEFEWNILIFENPAICSILAASGQSFGFLGRRTTSGVNGYIQAGIIEKIPVIGANITENNFDFEMNFFQQFTYPTIDSGTTNLNGDFRNITTGGFLVLLVTNIHKDVVFRSTVSNITININSGYTYDPKNNKIVRDPDIINKQWVADNYGLGTLLTGNPVDLNNIITPGNYYSGGGTVAQTALNLPISNGDYNFTVIVQKVVESSNWVVQWLKIYRNADDDKLYFRRGNGITWRNWFVFTGSVVT